MLGKGAILTVFGFILAFSVYQVKMSENVMATSDNFTNNYMGTLVHETSLSAMNIAINQVWDTGIDSADFMMRANHCSSNVKISKVGSDTVKVKVKSWGTMFDVEEKQYVTVADSISAYFSFSIPVSKYFWFTNMEGNVYWITGDTVWGPVHTNTIIKTWGSPVFYGKVTAKAGITPNPMTKKNKAKYYGGWEVGIDQSVPTDMTHLIDAAKTGNGGSFIPANTKCYYDQLTHFEFLSNGDVIRTVGANPPDTVKLTDIAPTGVIYSKEEVRVKGVMNGKLTVYTDKDIFIDDDLVYADDPNANPNSDDILGLVAENDIMVTDNAANNADCNVQAAVMAVTGHWGAENYATRPPSGLLNFTGSIVQNQRGPVGTFSWGTGLKSGFLKRYHFDPRLSSMAAPYYPTLNAMRLVSWWE
jgi:hypothetical protein